MGEVVYRSEVEVVRRQGRVREAQLPAEPEPIWFGVHGAVAKHYGADVGASEEHATTLDYVVAAAAG